MKTSFSHKVYMQMNVDVPVELLVTEWVEKQSTPHYRSRKTKDLETFLDKFESILSDMILCHSYHP